MESKDLENVVKYIENKEVRRICTINGHPNMDELNWGWYVEENCPDCGYSGRRPLTDSELERWMNKLYRPMFGNG